MTAKVDAKYLGHVQ